MPSFLRTSTGTEIWPCAVTLDCAIAMGEDYPGNASLSIRLRGARTAARKQPFISDSLGQTRTVMTEIPLRGVTCYGIRHQIDG